MLKLKLAFKVHNKSPEGINTVEIGNEKSKKKCFRPKSMVRYDDTTLNDYPGPIFVCKNCSKVCLNEEAATSHLNSCTGRSKNRSDQRVSKEQKTRTVQTAITKPTKGPVVPKDQKAPKARPRPIVSPDPYICMCCNFAFRRKVTYDQHMKEKEKEKESIISSHDESESEFKSPRMKKKHRQKSERDPTYYPNYDYKFINNS